MRNKQKIAASIFSFLALLGMPNKPIFSAEAEQFSNLSFNAYSTLQGLSQSSVLCIVQDKEGFIWMGTKDGLNRFDGYSFRHFRHDPKQHSSISSNEIITLSLSHEGDLFIGTRGGGLNKYLASEGSFIRITELSTFDNTVTSISCAGDGFVYVGTSEGLFECVPDKAGTHRYSCSNLSTVSTYNSQTGNLLPYDRSILSVVAIAPFPEKQFLIGTESGIFIFSPAAKTFRQLDLGNLNYSKINTMVWDVKKSEVLWVGTSEGIARLTFQNNQLQHYRIFDHHHPGWSKNDIDWINTLSIDSTGNLWVGTRGGGLITIDQKGEASHYYSDFSQSDRIGDNMVNSLLVDQTGVLWIGTESRGGVSLDLFRKKFNHLENQTPTGLSLTHDLVTAISGNSNTIWVGTAFNGLNRLEFSSDKLVWTEHFNQIPMGSGKTSNEIISLLYDNTNTLWIGAASNNVLTYHPQRGFKPIVAGGFVFSFLQDRENDIWIGTWGKGIGIYRPETNSFDLFSPSGTDNRSLSSDKVLSIFDDRWGNLWVGTKGGGLNVIPLQKIKQGYLQFTHYRPDDSDSLSLPHNDVYCMMADSKGNYWIGTGNGLCKVIFPDVDPNDNLLKGKVQFVKYTQENGLPGNVVYGILEDSMGKLWISTINGLSAFDLEKNYFKNFNVHDGVQSHEFHSNAYFKASNNRLFFGGDKGISFFNPNEISSNPFPSNIVISGLRVMNQTVYPNQKIFGKTILKKEIAHTDKITLSPKHKEFTLEFSALHFANPEGVQYAYRLLGFNEEWRYTTGSERSATYTNLWEGTYTFEVKATNNDGIWSDPVRQITIKVTPPYWRSPWFYLIYIVIIISGLLLFRRYSLIAVSEKNRLMIEQLERKNLVENTEAKMRFFTNISHEIRTPLTLISNPLDELIREGKLDEFSKGKLKLIAKNVARLLNLTNQLLQLRRIDKGGIEPHFSPVLLVPFTKDILGYFEQRAIQKSIELSFISEIDPSEQAWIDAEMITTSIYNLLSNSFKFTAQGGKIALRVYKKNTDEILPLLRKRKKNLPMFAIEVSDSGSGISQNEIEKIFIRFYQGQGNKKGDSAGSGIGLSLVKEYIELHQGEVLAESAKGKGTILTLLLPTGKKHVDNSSPHPILSAADTLLPVEEDRWDEPENGEKIENTTTSKGSYPKILIVEDDQDLAKYLAETLGSNYRTAICTNGKTGLAKTREWEPNLVVSDVMMPETNGNEMCQAIKSDIETSHIPVILLTAKASDENTYEGYQSGADLYITKPFKMELLEVQIKQLLLTRRQLQDKYSKQILLKPKDITITSIDEQFLEKLNTIIENNLSETDFDVTEMVKQMNMSHSTVLKKIKALTGMPLVEFVKNQRLKRAAQILVQDKLQIAEVAYMVGFSDPKYFSKCFSKAFGMTPSEYIAASKNKQKND